MSSARNVTTDDGDQNEWNECISSPVNCVMWNAIMDTSATEYARCVFLFHYKRVEANDLFLRLFFTPPPKKTTEMIWTDWTEAESTQYTLKVINCWVSEVKPFPLLVCQTIIRPQDDTEQRVSPSLTSRKRFTPLRHPVQRRVQPEHIWADHVEIRECVLKTGKMGYRGGKYLFILQFITLKHAHWGLTKYLTMGANQLFPVALRRDWKSVIPSVRLTGEEGSSIFCHHVCQRQQNVLINANGLCVCLCVSARVYATHRKGVSPCCLSLLKEIEIDEHTVLIHTIHSVYSFPQVFSQSHRILLHGRGSFQRTWRKQFKKSKIACVEVLNSRVIAAVEELQILRHYVIGFLTFYLLDFIISFKF